MQIDKYLNVNLGVFFFCYSEKKTRYRSKIDQYRKIDQCHEKTMALPVLSCLKLTMTACLHIFACMLQFVLA